MPYFFKITSVFFLATVKYFYTPIYAYVLGLALYETMFFMILGGIVSFMFFYYISHFIIISTKIIKPFAKSVTPYHLRDKYAAWRIRRGEKQNTRKRFTNRNRLIVKIRRDYGMWAIIFLTPVLLSIPVGAFLLRKYYAEKKFVVIYALFVLIIEGVILCSIFFRVPGIIE
jgi:hypothetical protein